jgi:hypothetical protein
VLTIPGSAAIAAVSWVVLQAVSPELVGLLALGGLLGWGASNIYRKTQVAREQPEVVLAPPQ